jgi:hypothetical protein
MADDITLTLTGIDWLGVVLAMLAAFFVGFVWFTFLFGKRWAKEFGIPMDAKPEAKGMAFSMGKDLVGHFIMAYVMWHSIAIWLPALWGAHFGVPAENAAMWGYGLMGAIFIWLGYFLPVSLSRTGWENRSWAWFGIDAGYNLVKLVVMGQILVAFM